MFYEAQRYYANILTPFRKLIPNAVKAVRGLKLRMICSCHGSIWRSHIEEILKLYEDWSLGKALDRIIIVYDTMWGGTAAMQRPSWMASKPRGCVLNCTAIRASRKPPS